jgi:hypothetical protein
MGASVASDSSTVVLNVIYAEKFSNTRSFDEWVVRRRFGHLSLCADLAGAVDVDGACNIARLKLAVVKTISQEQLHSFRAGMH